MTSMRRRAGSLAAALTCLVPSVGVVAACDSGPVGAVRSAVAPAPTTQAFPALDESALSPAQRRFVQIVRAEHAAQRPGTTYSDGVEEPWCADFVSWVSREAGTPLKNPNSGGWRVPGVFTLQEAFQAAGAWHPAGSGYVPKTGDVAIYAKPSPWGDHTNFVLQYADGRLTTIGGNEPGNIGITEHEVTPDLHVLGYGAR